MKSKNGRTSKRMYNLIIIDESGSMSVIHREALAGLNETMTTCKLTQKQHPELEQRITLVSFDSTKYKIHYDNAPVYKTRKLTGRDYMPMGGTPLYDAIGKSISRLDAQVGADDMVLVTIITDGEENCSREYNLRMVKNLIKKQKKQGWTFTLIGTDNLDVQGMAGSLAIDNHLSFAEDETGTTEMFRSERKARTRFYDRCAEGIKMPSGSFFNEDD